MIAIRSKLRFTLSASVIVIGIVAALLTVYTISAYAGTCSKLGGVPGVLQEAGFVPNGACQARGPEGNHCGGSCVISGKHGKCEARRTGRQDEVICVCVPRPISH